MLPKKKTLAPPGNDHGIVIEALLDFCRATRRAKLGEVAALKRLEESLLTIQGPHAQIETGTAPLTPGPRENLPIAKSSARHLSE